MALLVGAVRNYLWESIEGSLVTCAFHECVLIGSSTLWLPPCTLITVQLQDFSCGDPVVHSSAFLMVGTA